jgi:hypothetical protein
MEAPGPGDDDDDDDDDAKPGGGGGNIDPDDDEGYEDDEDDDEEEPLQVGPNQPRRADSGQTPRRRPHSVITSPLCGDLRVFDGCPLHAAVPRQPDHRFLISRFILPSVRV